jgi:hypothetical protein
MQLKVNDDIYKLLWLQAEGSLRLGTTLRQARGQPAGRCERFQQQNQRRDRRSIDFVTSLRLAVVVVKETFEGSKSTYYILGRKHNFVIKPPQRLSLSWLALWRRSFANKKESNSILNTIHGMSNRLLQYLLVVIRQIILSNSRKMTSGIRKRLK